MDTRAKERKLQVETSLADSLRPGRVIFIFRSQGLQCFDKYE